MERNRPITGLIRKKMRGERRARPEETCDQDGGEDERGAEVGLQHHQRHRQEHHADRLPERPERLGASRQPPSTRASIRITAIFANSDGWIRIGPDREPAGHALGGPGAGPDEEGEQQHDAGEPVHRLRRPLQPDDRDLQDEGRRDHRQREPEQLLPPESRHDGARDVEDARAVDHRDPEEGQRDDQQEELQVTQRQLSNGALHVSDLRNQAMAR
jgi:hypothetical protein